MEDPLRLDKLIHLFSRAVAVLAISGALASEQIAFALPTSDSVPQSIAFQAYVTDTQGTPITSAARMRFGL